MRRVLIGILAACLLGLSTYAATKLKPALPAVDRSAIWIDTVKRGPLLRQVRGLGSLVPIQDSIRQIPAETDATVARIRVLPGTEVAPDTVLVEMTNPQIEQAAVDATLQLRAAEAEYQSTRVRLESDLMDQKARAATLEADFNEARRHAESAKSLYELGVISGLANKEFQGKAEELTIRNELEGERLSINQKAVETRLVEQRAKTDQVRALAKLKQAQLDALRVRAGIEGVLVELPLQVGQHVSPGTMLAKVVAPGHLMAEIKVPETQARDVQLRQMASIDTHNGVVKGKVTRIDPAVQNGTVTVDVQLEGDLPPGMRPDLSVDGLIDLERIESTLYVGRPAFVQENSAISLFVCGTDKNEARRATVNVGRTSVNAIQILGGLKEGDSVVLSDMTRWDNKDQVRIKD